MVSEVISTESLGVLELQNTILEMVAKGEALKPTTDRLCVEIEKLLPDIVCSILWLDRSGLLHPLSGPSLPEEYSAAIDGAAIGPMVGSCGTAAYLRTPVAVTDIRNLITGGPTTGGFRSARTLKHVGRRRFAVATTASWAPSPSRENRGPTAAEQRIVDTCVYLCAIALERHERVLERERLARTEFVDGSSQSSEL